MTHYEIFSECFPGLELTEKQFDTLADEGNCQSFDIPEGFALTKGNQLRLICVLPDKRRCGAGTRLFSAAEQHIRNLGFDRMETGGTDSELLIGVPEECAGFFEKQGCTLGEAVAEMNAGELNLPDPESGAGFGVFSGSPEELRAAVAAVEPDWVPYFAEGEFFCATVGGKIASFCILGRDETCILSRGDSRMGSIGCVGTVPEFRRRGIGLEMVAEATRLLLADGCDDIFIHYTAVYRWYSRLGYRTRLILRLGGKDL